MDYLGGSGNGLAWYTDVNSKLTEQPTYQAMSVLTVENLNAVQLKAILNDCLASAEAAPIINYLVWLITIKEATA